MRDQLVRGMGYFDSTATVNSLQNDVIQLNGLSEGFAENNLAGGTLLMKKLFLSGYFQNETGTPTARVSVVLDRQPTAGALAPLSSIFAATSTTAPLLDNNMDRFVLLYDNVQVTNTSTFVQRYFEAEIDLDITSVHANATANPLTNALLLTYIFDGGANQAITYYARLRYAKA